MANLYDYLYWRGDIGFDERPFNDVDNVVLSTLSYLDFTGIVPAEPEQGCVTVAEACRALIEGCGGDIAPRVRSLIKVETRFAELLAASTRFGTAELSAYVDVVDRSRSLQFSAVRIDLTNGETYVAYRGTDQTLVGWREDFMLGFTVTEAQRQACSYLEAVMARLPKARPVRVGGHSKGGNLAEYAASSCPREMRDRIVMVYSNDGPRMSPEVISLDTRRELGERLRCILPSFSIVGMLFAREDDPRTIVASSATAIAQHDLTTWQVTPAGMEEVDDFLPECRVYNKSVSLWTSNVTQDGLRITTNEVFDALGAGGAKTFDEVATTPESLQRVLQALSTADEATRAFGVALIENTIATSVAAVRKTLTETTETWRKGMQEAAESAARKLFGPSEQQEGEPVGLLAGETAQEHGSQRDDDGPGKRGAKRADRNARAEELRGDRAGQLKHESVEDQVEEAKRNHGERQ